MQVGVLFSVFLASFVIQFSDILNNNFDVLIKLVRGTTAQDIIIVNIVALGKQIL